MVRGFEFEEEKKARQKKRWGYFRYPLPEGTTQNHRYPSSPGCSDHAVCGKRQKKKMIHPPWNTIGSRGICDDSISGLFLVLGKNSKILDLCSRFFPFFGWGFLPFFGLSELYPHCSGVISRKWTSS